MKITISGNIAATTTLAILLTVKDIDGSDENAGEQVWIPRSEIEDDSSCDLGEDVEIEVSGWLLEAKGVY